MVILGNQNKNPANTKYFCNIYTMSARRLHGKTKAMSLKINDFFKIHL